MPHIQQLFADIADIHLVDGRQIARRHLLDADALLCRSITQVNRELLQGSQVQFVGTATIGIDHLDIHWLDENKIRWTNAAGCNADAVAQYVLSAISYWLTQQKKSLQQIRVGIVGAGNVGSALSRCLDSLGIDYLLCDPPLQTNGDPRAMVNLEQILTCDVITLHVPLNKQGKHKTEYLIDQSILSRLSCEQLLINASRGAVINNSDLMSYLRLDNSADVVLDVFEHEPAISHELVHRCLLATPHIAGHSLEGKSRGSYMIYQAFCEYFGLDCHVSESQLYPANNQSDQSVEFTQELSAILAIYDIEADHERLKAISESELKLQFDKLRKAYPNEVRKFVRRDYCGWDTSRDLPDSICRLINDSKI